MYAQLCRKISEGAKNFELENQNHGKSELYENTFCKYLLAKCRNEFDNRCQASEAFGDGPLSEQDEERRDQAKKVMLGNIKFICELGKQNLAEEAILHRCIQELLRKKNNTKNFVEDLECLCQIMKTIGKLLDTERSKSLMDQYFNRMEKYATHHNLPLRIKFKIQDSLDLRRNKWVPRNVQVDQNPKTLIQIREEATKDYSFLQPGGSLMGNFMPNSYGNNPNSSNNMRGNFNYSGSPYFAASGQRAIDDLFGSQYNFTNSFNSNNSNNNFENSNSSNNSNSYQQQQSVRRTNNQHQNNYLRQNKNNDNINSSSSSSNSSFVREEDSNMRNTNRENNNRKENNNFVNRQENFRENKDFHQNEDRQNFANNHYRNNMNNHDNKHVNFNNQNNPNNSGNPNMNSNNNNRFNNYNNNYNNNFNNNYQNRNNSIERNMNNKMNNLNIRDQNNVSNRNELPPRFQKIQQPPTNQYQQNRNFNNNNNNQDFGNQQRPNNYNNNSYNKNNYGNNNFNNNFNHNQQGNQYQRQNYNNYNNNNKIISNTNNSNNNSINLHPPSQKLVAQVPNFNAMDSKEISLRPAINFVVSKPNASGNNTKPEVNKNNANIGLEKKNLNDSSSSSNNPEEKIAEKVVVKDQKERYLESVNEILVELLDKKLNENESFLKIKEQYIVKVTKSCLLAHIMKYALGKSENERESITNFVTKLYTDKFCATEDFITAFKEILKSMSDLEVDVPKVKSFVAVYIAKAVKDEIIDLKEAFNLTVKTVYYPLFLLCLQFLGQNQDQTWLTNKFNESKLDLMLALPEIDRNKDRLSEVLRDRQLGFLYPLLRIESELMKQVNVGEEISPKSLYTWIKENVDSNLQKTEGFIITLFTCLAKYVTEKTKPLIAEIKEEGSNADKQILEIEKEIMSKYAQIFQSFLLERQDLQLVLLYALQTYCHELGFPKGMIFRWFILLYDLEIVDGEVFLKWKEEVNDNYPDKGKALFQVNNWLIWLEKAEQDEEEEEEDA